MLTTNFKGAIIFTFLFHDHITQNSFFKIHRCILWFNLLKPTGHVMHQQFNIQQLYDLPTLYLCVS